MLSPESELQCGAWLLSLGASFMFGSQAVLAWRRWKIQNAHFFIRLEYWATIILLVILGKFLSPDDHTYFKYETFKYDI